MEDNVMTLRIDDIARMANSQWARLKKKNRLKFSCEEAEGQCKMLFICGYHAALTDMAEVCSGMMQLDKM